MRIPARSLLAGAGIVGAAVAAGLEPDFAAASAKQDYPAFALVAGLLLIGLGADDEGLFAVAGAWLGRLARNGFALFTGAVVLVGAVTATLNLDTSVAFLTPVLIYAARDRKAGESALLYGCLLLSNAGSLLLPGSNLTNLIVLGQLRLSGGQFVARMWLPALAALAVTALVVLVLERRCLAAEPGDPAARDEQVTAHGQEPAPGLRPGIGPVLALAAVVAATVLVVVLRDPAIPVLAVGVVTAGVHLIRGRADSSRIAEVLGVPVLTGLFGIAVALGALGRAWSGPATLLAHLNSVGVAALAATATVLVNNLPAASLLAARAGIGHPLPLLIGLNLGPNLCVTGSLAWLIWLRAARGAGAEPTLARASLLGAVAVPLAMAAALAGLALTGSR
jgi:arsenical pump membrane protein